MALNGLAHQVSKVMENEADSRRKEVFDFPTGRRTPYGEVRQEAKWGEMSSPVLPRIREF